jgi:hypothetical protein
MHIKRAHRMDPVIIEVRCNWGQDDPRWQETSTLSLEIGYPTLGGKMLWKNIGWLREQWGATGRSFAHALWKPKMAGQVLLFDFLPLVLPQAAEPEKNYRIRKRITDAEGRLRTSKSALLRGDYADEHFSLHPQYPTLRK